MTFLSLLGLLVFVSWLWASAIDRSSQPGVPLPLAIARRDARRKVRQWSPLRMHMWGKLRAQETRPNRRVM